MTLCFFFGIDLKAGIAISPLTDLISYTITAHPFARHYHHSLLGPLPEQQDLYIQRYNVLQNLSLSVLLCSVLFCSVLNCFYSYN
jgi:hypothetical protein